MHLGNTFLESMLNQYGLKDKSAPHRMPNTTVAQAVRWVRSRVRGVPAHILIWTLIVCSTAFCLLQRLQNRKKRTTVCDNAENPPDCSSDHFGKSNEQQAVEEEDEEDMEDEVEEVEEGEKDKEEEEEDPNEKDEIPRKR